MAEVSKQHSCDNCGSDYQLTYESDDVSYEPDNCPFCGDVLNEQEEFGFTSEDSIAWDSDTESEDDEDLE